MPTKKVTEILSKWEWQRKSQEAADRRWYAENAELARAWDEAVAFEQEQRDSKRAAAHRVSVDRALGALGVPDRCRELFGWPLQETDATKAVEKFGGGNFLLMLGRPGCGKTVAAVSLMRRRLLSVCQLPDFPRANHVKPEAMFLRASTASRMGLYGDEAREAFEDWSLTEVLVLDDLGAEMLSDSWRALFDELMDVRYGANRRTVITSNLDAAALTERYGLRVMDRIRHSGTIVGVGAQSMRKRPER